MPSDFRRAFTLIELLVVIAIIAILTVVVILTLNPAELLKQSRDSNRLSDMATISNALNVYLTDQGTASSFSLGATSATYPSVYDPSATSTAGDQCQGLSMPALNASSGQYWQCSANTTQRLVNGTGWIPVNLSAISSGAPVGSFPVDPTNQTSSGLMYTYNTNGTQFEVTANLESQKYKVQFAANPQTSYFPELITGGNPKMSALYNPTGLVGYWNMDEGAGTTTYDSSGNGNSGNWNGTASGGNGTYYSGGKVGSYAGYFNASNDYVLAGKNNVPVGSSPRSVFAWINLPSSATTGFYTISLYGQESTVDDGVWLFVLLGQNLYFAGGNGNNFESPLTITPNTWHFVGYTYGGGTSVTLYQDNQPPQTGTISQLNTIIPSGSSTFVGWDGINAYFSGSIDDVRMYNRALSAAEVQALYSAEH